MWRFDFGGGVEVYDARARMWSPKLGTFLWWMSSTFHDQTTTLWGWGGQNPIRWSDPFGRNVVSYAHQAQLLNEQQDDLFGASAFFASQTADAWASGSYGAAAFDASVTAATGLGGAFVSLLPRHPESADFATLACPIEAGARPPNLSPPGAGRSGAFRAAKEASGIPRSQQPSRVLPNTNKSGVPQPCRSYEFEVPRGGGSRETDTINIREDSAGHTYGPNDPQNRGPHFNDPQGGRLPTVSMWLLSFHSTWQEDSLIARKVGFWNQRKLQKRYLPPLHRAELGLFKDEKCRFFGAGSFGREDLSHVLEFVEEERQALLVVSMGLEPNLPGFVSCGFGDERRIMPPLLGRLAAYASREQFLLLRMFGEFDDREVGVDVVGAAQMVRKLL